MDRLDNTKVTSETPFEGVSYEQWLGLSWIAYFHRSTLLSLEDLNNKHGINTSSYEAILKTNTISKASALLGAETVCKSVLNVSEDHVYEIKINNNCKGLLNLNRIASIEIWEY